MFNRWAIQCKVMVVSSRNRRASFELLGVAFATLRQFRDGPTPLVFRQASVSVLRNSTRFRWMRKMGSRRSPRLRR